MTTELERLVMRIRDAKTNNHLRLGDVLELLEESAVSIERLIYARAVADDQAEDEGLWFEAETAPEAYLQAALRQLAAAIEDA